VSHGILRTPRRAALIAIAALVAAASLASFAESYRGLLDWAREHDLSGGWAAAFPLQVDVFIAVGELALFVALVDAWGHRSRIAAWVVTGVGLVVSVAGNVGHVTGHSAADRLTAGVPPIAAAAALAVGLGVLKRVVEHVPVTSPDAVPADVVEAARVSMKATVDAGNPWSQNQLVTKFGLKRAEAGEIWHEFVPGVAGTASPRSPGPSLPPELPDPGHTLNGNGHHA
jgi:hypothetical protein